MQPPTQSMNRLLCNYPGVPNVYLKISDGGLYAQPTTVQTVLGSCVSVTFHDPVTKYGAIFHALLPRVDQFEFRVQLTNHFKYVDTAIDLLLDKLREAGVSLSKLQVKVFGGANQNFQHGLDIGEQNIAAAMETLERHRLPVAASNTGGPRGRKILFVSHTGEVYLKMLNTPLHE